MTNDFWIFVEYDELADDPQATYKSVGLWRGRGSSKERWLFDSGDIVRDYANALAVIKQSGATSYGRSSTCDHFLMDGNSFAMGADADGWETIVRKNEWHRARETAAEVVIALQSDSRTDGLLMPQLKSREQLSAYIDAVADAVYSWRMYLQSEGQDRNDG